MQLLCEESPIDQHVCIVAFYCGSVLYLMTLCLFLREPPFEMCSLRYKIYCSAVH